MRRERLYDFRQVFRRATVNKVEVCGHTCRTMGKGSDATNDDKLNARRGKSLE